jgi:hypothetical protein
MRAPPGSIALVVLAACGDPSLDVTFDLPPGYEEMTASVVLDVIAPGDEPFDCRQLELGEVDPTTVTALVVDQALAGPSGRSTDLDAVPRTGLKLFHARAYNDLDQLVAAGCAAHELIDGDVSIRVEGRPAAYISARDTTLRSSGELERLKVALSDAHGDPLPGVAAFYRVVAANSETELREATSDEDGQLELPLAAPEWDGPQMVDIDVPWQANPIETISGFRTPAPRFQIDIPAAVQPQDLRSEQLVQIGRVGPDGEMGLAMLGPPSEAGERLVHIYYYKGRAMVPVVSDSAVTASAIGLIDGGARDRVLLLGADAWHEIGADGAVTTHAESLGLAGDARRIVPLPSTCTVDAPRDTMLVDDGAGAVLLGADLESIESRLAAPGALVAAGCLLGKGEIARSAVFQRGAALELEAEITGARAAVLPTLSRRGIAFTPAIDSSAASGPYLLVNRLEADGESIARYSLVRGPDNRLALDVELEDEVAGQSIATTGGDFDGDKLPDVAGLLLLADLDQSRQVRVFIALGRAVEGVRLAGLSRAIAIGDAGTERFLDSQLIAADLDGDGYDELVIAGRAGADIYDLVP